MYSALKEIDKKVISELNYQDKFANILVSMFDTEETNTNPFFEKWEKEEFENMLLKFGYVAIWFDELEKNYVFSQCEFIGNIDFMGKGVDLFCSTQNGHSKTFSNWRENEDVVVIFNNDSHTKDLNIERYAEMSTETWVSMLSAIIGTRYNDILIAKDEKTKIALKTVLENSKNGIPYVVVSDNILADLNEQEMINHIQLSDFKNSDKIQYLSNFMTFIERNFFNLYGMTTQGSDKIAQQTKAEVENGIFCAWIEVLSRLKERQKGFKEVKEKFNIDIPYKLSEVWEKEYNRIFEEKTLEQKTEENVEENIEEREEETLESDTN